MRVSSCFMGARGHAASPQTDYPSRRTTCSTCVAPPGDCPSPFHRARPAKSFSVKRAKPTRKLSPVRAADVPRTATAEIRLQVMPSCLTASSLMGASGLVKGIPGARAFLFRVRNLPLARPPPLSSILNFCAGTIVRFPRDPFGRARLRGKCNAAQKRPQARSRPQQRNPCGHTTSASDASHKRAA